MANMTFTQAEVLVNNSEQFELLTMEEVVEVAKAIYASKSKKVEALTKKFARLLELRKEVAPKEEIKAIVEVENSIKTASPKSTSAKVTPKAKANAQAKATGKSKITPKAQTEDKVAEEDSEDEIHEGLIARIDSSNFKELKALAVEYGVKVPTVIATEKLRNMLKEQIVGFVPTDVAPPKEDKPKANTNTDSPFPETDESGNVRVDFKDLAKKVQANPYKVVAYVQEKGQKTLTPFTVIFANSEIVVLLDSVVVKNSVITCDKTHFSKNGTILSLDDNLCPVAFYAPKK